MSNAAYTVFESFNGWIEEGGYCSYGWNKFLYSMFHIFRWSKIPGNIVVKADLGNKYEHDKQDDIKLLNCILWNLFQKLMETEYIFDIY